MSDRLKSGRRASYIKSAEVTEEDLTRVLRQISFRSPEEEPLARERLREILDEFYTQRESTEFARSRDTDVQDLELLLDRIRDAKRTGDRHGVREVIRWLGGSDPQAHPENLPLRQRIGTEIGHHGLSGPRGLEMLIDREETIEQLLQEIKDESRSGRREDPAGRWLANRLFELWTRFCDESTSSNNWRGDAPYDGGPFPDFVRAVGKLVDPNFNGYDFARAVHRERGNRPAA
jgi:hypothetical protein